MTLMLRSRSRHLIAFVVAAAIAGCTSMDTAPSTSSLPTFAFQSLRGAPVAIAVFDQRPGERSGEWKALVERDLHAVLAAAGANVVINGATHFEVRLLRARSDFEAGQWNGCVELTGRVFGERELEASGGACVAKANLWGKGTADNVLKLAYQDAMTKLLSSLDSRL
jgi:hypothetical protein